MKKKDNSFNCFIKYFLQIQYFAAKKGAGTVKNGPDSHSKRLGVKRNHGQYVTSGTIIIRQRGTRFLPKLFGKTVILGKDHTISAKIDGIVTFERSGKYRRMISIVKQI